MDDLDELLKELTEEVADEHTVDSTRKTNFENAEADELLNKADLNFAEDDNALDLNKILEELDLNDTTKRVSAADDLDLLMEDLNFDKSLQTFTETEEKDLNNLMQMLKSMESDIISKDETIGSKGSRNDNKFTDSIKLSPKRASEKSSRTSTIDDDMMLNMCYTCLEPISPTEIVFALGKSFHAEHFICSSCGKQLDSKKFYELSKKQLCENCFQEQMCFRCFKCKKLITDDCLEALNERWHKNCFTCSECNCVINGKYFVHDDRPCCSECNERKFAIRCKMCNKEIIGNYISAINSYWHTEHFNCYMCHTPFEGAYYQHNDMPYCEFHYYETLGLICPSCRSPIYKTFIEALGQRWHPDHFNCSYCGISLMSNVYNDHGGKLYCKDCYSHMFT